MGHVKILVHRPEKAKKGVNESYSVTKYQGLANPAPLLMTRVLTFHTPFVPVEFNKFYYEASTPFEERWLDVVIERKLKLKALVDLNDDFLHSRLEQDGGDDLVIP